MGAASVLLAAAQEPAVKAVIADRGYADFGRIMRREWYRRTHLPSLILPSAQVAGQLWLGHDVLSVRPIDRVADIKSRVLFIHAANDTLIPPSDSQDMQAKLPDRRCGFSPVLVTLPASMPTPPDTSSTSPTSLARRCAISIPTAAGFA